ncbi:MAG: pyridoxal phosphate-dependent aminotransferase [Acidobacteria bacterium]|nr:MAG: pyridoxal phosphate-dependent aminotransferase [Acidobacteriota bacterium]
MGGRPGGRPRRGGDREAPRRGDGRAGGPRGGVAVSPRPARRVAGLRRTLIREIFESAPPDAVNLGLGEPDVDPPEGLRRALAEEARRGPAGYGPTAGCPELRERIASLYPGFAGGAGDVVVTAGAQQAMFAVIGALADPGDEVLVPDPGFPGAARAAAAWGAVPRSYPLDPGRRFHLEAEAVLRLAGPRTRAIVVISPANPTGVVEPAPELERLMEGAAERGIAVVLDDVYAELCWVGNGRAPGPPPRPERAVVAVGGLSKAAAIPGWRVGWAVCPDREFTSRLVAIQQTVLTCAPVPTQRAAAAYLAEERDALAGVRETYRRRAALLSERLQRAGIRHAPLEGGFYAWLDASAAGGGMAVARRLLERDRIVVIPGEAFGPSGKDWIRVSYAQPLPRLLDAFDAVLAALRG